MAIKRVTYDTLKFLVAEIKERYAEKGDIGALGGLDKVAVENLTEDLKSLINGKADAATTLAGYGIKDGMPVLGTPQKEEEPMARPSGSPIHKKQN